MVLAGKILLGHIEHAKVILEFLRSSLVTQMNHIPTALDMKQWSFTYFVSHFGFKKQFWHSLHPVMNSCRCNQIYKLVGL